MWHMHVFALIMTSALLILIGSPGAKAQCPAVPYQLSNGQATDATQVMANFDALLSCLNTGQFVPSVGSDLQVTGNVLDLAPTAVTPGTYTMSTVTVDAKGRLTSAASGPSTGTLGHVLPFLDGSNTWSGTQTFGPVIGAVSTQSGTSYTLAASDCGTTIFFTNTSPISVTTLNSLPVGCAIAIEQHGGGQVTITAGSGATQHSAHGFTKTYGQYAILGLFVDTNAGGSAADIIITGDGA